MVCRLSFALLLASSALLAKADGVSVPGHKMATPPTIDGTIDDANEWKDVPFVEGLFDASTGQPSPEGGKFWIGYDANFVYFAARLADSQPNSILANEYRTNVSVENDDWVGIALDLAGSLANFNQFSMNSRGATSVQLAAGSADKIEWTGEFLAKGRITATGWEAEARIPWQVMRLPGAGTRNVRFNIFRGMPRLNRTFTWAYTGGGATDNVGRWTNVELPKTPFQRKLKLLPFTYLGKGEDEGFIANAGLDLRTNITEQIDFVGTINPDFRNIENNILSLDFSRFERLAGETRPFFLEGNQYMNTGLYASQRIGKFDAGANVYGKLTDKISFGLIDAADFGKSNSFVTNATYDPTPNDSIRGTFASLSDPNVKNDSYLVRYFKTMGPYSLFLRNMGSKDSKIGGGQSNTINANYNQGPWNAFLSWDNASPNFVPRLGFAPEVDYKGWTAGGGFNQSYNSGMIRDLGVFLFGLDYDQFSGGHYRRSFNPAVNFGIHNGPSVFLSANWDEFFGVEDKLYTLSAGYPRTSPYNHIGVTYNWGEFGYEPYRSWSIGGSYRPTQQLTFTGSYQKVKYYDTSDQAIVGMNYDLGHGFYLSGRAVKRNDDLNAYISFRRSGVKGVEHYLIFGDPNSRTFKASLILKVVMPIELKF